MKQVIVILVGALVASLPGTIIEVSSATIADSTRTMEDCEEPENFKFDDKYSKNAYLLFTRQNNVTGQLLILNDSKSVHNSHFDPNKVTVTLSHGWLMSAEDDMNTRLTEAFLKDGDVNVIVHDWHKLSQKTYFLAKKATAPVGRELGRFIMWLTSFGLSLDKAHLVGFSLGGHVVGNAGRETGGLVRRITALDPAGPLFLTDKNRLAATDGQYVEVIHTTRLAGFPTTGLGHADFFVNDILDIFGVMPGCEDIDHPTNDTVPQTLCHQSEDEESSNLRIGEKIKSVTCSHQRAYMYMASSIAYNHFEGKECANVSDAQDNACSGSTYLMGTNDLNKNRSGIFRVNTRKDWPY